MIAIAVRPDKYPIPVGYLRVLSIAHYDVGDWVVARWARSGYLVAGWAVYGPTIPDRFRNCLSDNARF